MNNAWKLTNIVDVRQRDRFERRLIFGLVYPSVSLEAFATVVDACQVSAASIRFAARFRHFIAHFVFCHLHLLTHLICKLKDSNTIFN
jgi:hypothetical protein